MGDNRLIAKNSLILYVRLLVTSVISIITVRFILKLLGTSDYGLYSVVGGIVFIMAFLNNVMVSTTYRFVAYEMGKGDINAVNKVFNVSLVIHIGLAFLTLLLAETAGIFYIMNYLQVPDGKLPDAVFVFRMSVYATFFRILSIPFQGLITANEQFKIPAMIEIFRNTMALIAVLLLFKFNTNALRMYALLIAIISIIPPLFYFMYSKKHYPTIISWKLQRDRSKYKEMIGFSGWILFGASASTAEVKVSALIINVFFGTLVNAAFGLATQVNSMVKMFAQSLNKAVIPQITKSFSGGDVGRTLELVVFSSKYSFFLMLLPSLPILFETEYIVNIWLGVVPEYVIPFIQIMVINALIEITNAGIPAAVQATGKIKYFQIILSSITLLALPVAFILFKLGYEPYWMALVFTMTASINIVLRQILLKKLIQFDTAYFISNAYIPMIIVCLAIAPLWIVKINMAVPLLTILISIVWLLLVIYFLGIKRNERRVLNRFLALNIKKILVKHNTGTL